MSSPKLPSRRMRDLPQSLLLFRASAYRGARAAAVAAGGSGIIAVCDLGPSRARRKALRLGRVITYIARAIGRSRFGRLPSTSMWPVSGAV